MPHKKELSQKKDSNKKKVELSVTQPSSFQKKEVNYFQQQNKKGKSYNQQSLKTHHEDDQKKT
jgi:hypothetical protein